MSSFWCLHLFSPLSFGLFWPPSLAYSLVQFSSVAQSCPILCDPVDCSMPGFPVHHQHPELAQTHVHRFGDAIQPSHPLLSPSPPHSIFQSIRVFSNESVFPIRWPEYWRFSFSPSNEYSGLRLKQLSTRGKKDPNTPITTSVVILEILTNK